MSVNKVKISELNQLPQDADASDIFMPAADSNNKTYRVPLSRYDNAKSEANIAAEVALNAAQTAYTAAENANNAASGALASPGNPGIVMGLSGNAIDHINVFYNNITAAWNSMIERGNMIYVNGIGHFLTSVFVLQDILDSEAMAGFLYRPLNNNYTEMNPAIISFSVIGTYQPTLEEDPFLEEYNQNGTVEFTIDEPLSCFIFGGGTFVTWRGYAAFVTPPNEDGRSWYKLGGSGPDYTLPAATKYVLGGIKIGAGLTTDEYGTTRIADNADLPGIPKASALEIPQDNTKMEADGTILTQKTYRDYQCRAVDNNQQGFSDIVNYRVIRGGLSQIDIAVRRLELGYFDEYKIEYKADRTNIKVVASDGVNGYSATFSGLTEGKWYLITIIARNTNGNLSGGFLIQDAF